MSYVLLHTRAFALGGWLRVVCVWGGGQGYDWVQQGGGGWWYVTGTGSGSEGGAMLARVSIHCTLTLEPFGVLCYNRRSAMTVINTPSVPAQGSPVAAVLRGWCIIICTRWPCVCGVVLTAVLPASSLFMGVAA